ncbi:hypothetical protein [Comamonas suwonensis]|uniref:Uncharacterized protein n=1 Tax=Comamonas suwonensis TaxID=2606214 RepID=A0A843BA43_9BURK|nr:hypothetical protein [Comamonas suwonensis]MBI1626645.1 hypothetical protein [Comamonas suwonensis]
MLDIHVFPLWSQGAWTAAHQVALPHTPHSALQKPAAQLCRPAWKMTIATAFIDRQLAHSKPQTAFAERPRRHVGAFGQKISQPLFKQQIKVIGDEERR